MERCRFNSAQAFADERTWVGPTAQACSTDLARLRRMLLHRVEELRLAARRLDRAADDALRSESTGGPA
jgi:hypothetical protein